MRSLACVLFLSATLLPGSLFAQSPIDSDVDGLLGHIDGTTREHQLVGRHVFAIDMEVSGRLVALAERYKFRYEIPRDADPAAILKTLRGRTERARAEAGYTALKEKLAALEAFADGSGDAAEVKRLATELALLTWALKGHVLLEAINYRDGGTREGNDAVGSDGTIPDWDNSSSLLGGGSAWSGTIMDWGTRRAQAEAVGLNYPNADLGTWLWKRD